MRLTINQSDLSTHLEKVKPIIPNRPTHPILGNFVLQATEGQLTISAFNLSLGVKTSLKAEVSGLGTITVPAKLLSGLIASLPNQSLTLEVDENKEENNDILWIKCSESKYQIRYLDVDEYPDIPSLDESETISIKMKTFIELLNPVLPTYSEDETKQVLVGVHLVGKNNKLELATTDGHRLSVTGALLESDSENPVDYKEMDLTIRGKDLEYLYKNIKDLDPTEELKISWNKELVKFNLTSSVITTRLLQGVYPNYNELIPPQFKGQLTFIGSEMIEAVKRLLLLNPDKNIIVIEANKNLQTLTVTTFDTEVGQGSETIHAEFALNLKMGVNGKYLIEAIKALDAKSLTMNINTPTSPAVLVPSECTLARCLVLIMPFTIKGSDMYVEDINYKDKSTTNNPSLPDDNIENPQENDNNDEPIVEEDLPSEISVVAHDVPVLPETSEPQKIAESIQDTPVEESQPATKKKNSKRKKSVAHH
ncbi:DNA polymerase III, beta subunit (plasmid) [Gloeothece citriformis PCC 7424]|uniref:DNA polymerase III, beta subunit n=1 Tax=Gloeothece citriformis (strain PCC 7424) TaxID=65393 RepID=B7KMQ3_GLOC7|nr:DNA polymerase III subunit beta [Gloeothece citriformis]ACK74075.1 DNA polymerase III, beta subunit [Gloeothece citriformis PCC 7424]